MLLFKVSNKQISFVNIILLELVFTILSIYPGTGVSVEAVDPVFQAKMLDMLKQTGRPEMVVGWYHSHPGFGCWLSGRYLKPRAPNIQMWPNLNVFLSMLRL